MKRHSKNLRKRLKRYEHLFRISRKLTPEERVRRVFEFYDLIMKVRERIIKGKI